MDIGMTLEPWHWLILLFLLLGAEALGAGGFLLGSAAAAGLLAIVIWLSPIMSWPVQLIVYGAASLIFTLAYWKFFRRVNNRNDSPELNNRAMQLVGRSVVLPQDLPAGVSKLQIGDTFWKVQCDRPVAKDRRIVVRGYQGMTLMVMEQG